MQNRSELKYADHTYFTENFRGAHEIARRKGIKIGRYFSRSHAVVQSNAPFQGLTLLLKESFYNSSRFDMKFCNEDYASAFVEESAILASRDHEPISMFMSDDAT